MIPIPSHSSPSQSWLNRVKQALFSENEPQTKKELTSLLRESQKRGIISIDTLGMIEGALQVAEMQVRDVMIPRAQMVVLDLHASPNELIKTIIHSGHSRFPVIGENRDDVQGIFLAKDLLDYYARSHIKQSFDMRDVMRPAVFIPESKRLNVLLREFRTSRNHMAIVVDEYSGVAGLLTIEDVIEQIVGDIDDEHDIDDHQIFIKPTRNGLYTVRALTPIEDFNAYFKTTFSDEEFDTIGGLVMQAFGHLPKRGESLQLGDFYFEVARSNSRRIHLLRVKPSSSPALLDIHNG